MTARDSEISAELTCHSCGYDLRAHPPAGQCPECGTSVAESRRVAAIPYRPAWRDSDPRWRRRMLAGSLILLLMPLIDTLQTFGWASHVHVPTLFDYRGPITLDELIICWPGVYQPLILCIGIVLLFSKERRRRRVKLDWTRRWGVLCSYVVLLLSAAPILFISSLVLAGIAALFLSMPLKDQPHITLFFVQISYAYLHFGPCAETMSLVALHAFSSITILLACIALFDALRSSGPRLLAIIVLAPLALFALLYLAEDAWYCLGSRSPNGDIYNFRFYFWPEVLLQYIRDLPAGLSASGSFIAVWMEITKWLILLAIAIWLTIAQLAAWSHRNKTRVQNPVY